MSKSILSAAKEIVSKELDVFDGASLSYSGKVIEVNSSDWDFYITKTATIDCSFNNQECIGLPMIEPFAIHTKIGGIKQAVSLACDI